MRNLIVLEPWKHCRPILKTRECLCSSSASQFCLSWLHVNLMRWAANISSEPFCVGKDFFSAFCVGEEFFSTLLHWGRFLLYHFALGKIFSLPFFVGGVSSKTTQYISIPLIWITLHSLNVSHNSQNTQNDDDELKMNSPARKYWWCLDLRGGRHCQEEG